MVRKFIFIFLLLVIIFSPSACGSKEVTFHDQNLEVAIREAIDKPESEITVTDLRNLFFLHASRMGINDLTGLEYCINLDKLYLDHNNLNDLS